MLHIDTSVQIAVRANELGLYPGQCAEIQSFSNAMRSRIDVWGSVMSAAETRSPNSAAAGKTISPWARCSAVMEQFEVT